METEYQVHVHVIEARGLCAKDVTCKSDPLCVVEVTPFSRRSGYTDCKPSTVNAVWEANFCWENIKLTEEQFNCEKVAFEVFDRNEIIRNELIGCYECSLSYIYHRKNHELFRVWVPLSKDEITQGYLLLSAFVLRAGDIPPRHSEEEYIKESESSDFFDTPQIFRDPYLLKVFVYRGADFIQRNGYADYFILVRFNGHIARTHTVPNSDSPSYNRMLQLPFHHPIMSHSIEIQLWQENARSPDSLIGTIIRYESELFQKSEGPVWLLFYNTSATTSESNLIGMTSNKQYSERNDRPSEYVGRILVRLVCQSTDIPPRLETRSCDAIVREPPLIEYVLRFVVYQIAEIPVLGGYLAVSVSFGTKKRNTTWIMGQNGVYNWKEVGFDQRFSEAIRINYPRNIDQVPDVIISVLHRIGNIRTKIAYSRITAKSLLARENNNSDIIRGLTFIYNGDRFEDWKNKDISESKKPFWRSLAHNTQPTPDQNNLVAGFLLCNIAFGTQPSSRDLSDKFWIDLPKENPYALRAKIYMASSIPSAENNGLSNPFIALRFAGKHAITRTEYGTLWPVYFQELVLKVEININHPPCIYLLIYHQTSAFSNVFLTRTRIEIDSGMIFDNNVSSSSPSPRRYRLNQGSYIIASFELYPLTSIKDEVPLDSPEKWIPHFEEKTLFLRYIGLRSLCHSVFSNLNKPSVKILYSSHFSISKSKCNDPYSSLIGLSETVVNTDKKHHESYNFNLSQPPIIFKINFPYGYLNYLAFTFNLIDKESNVLSSFHLPFSDIFSLSENNTDFLIEEQQSPKKLKLLSLTPNDISVDEIEQKQSQKKKENHPIFTFNNHSNSKYQQLEEAEQEHKQETTPNKMNNYKNNNNNELKLEMERDNDTYINFDISSTNIKMETFTLYKEGKPPIINEKKNKNDEYVLDNIEDSPEFIDSLVKDNLREMWFYRGKCIDLNSNSNKLSRTKSGLFKFVVSETSLPRLTLESISQFSYVTRIYIYRGLNLTPRYAYANNSCGKTLNPYLVIRNGNYPYNQFHDRQNYKQDDLNPDFYKIYELKTALPSNSHCVIEVWDRGIVSDQLVGSTSIDIEQRLSNTYWQKLFISNSLPTECRVLSNSRSVLSQGTIECKVEVIEESKLRQYKAKPIHPPIPEQYELRLIIWQTRGVANPDDTNASIDQMLSATFNYTGKEGMDIIKYTDIAWNSIEDAEWNYRMIFPCTIPCKVPRIKFSLWDHRYTSRCVFLGEAVVNLGNFFSESKLSKRSISHKPRFWVPFSHPNVDKDFVLGEIEIEIWAYSKASALQNPCGEGQNEPNREPFLPSPQRELPPFAILSKGIRALEWLARRKFLIIVIAILLVIIPIVLPVLFKWLKNKVMDGD